MDYCGCQFSTFANWKFPVTKTNQQKFNFQIFDYKLFWNESNNCQKTKAKNKQTIESDGQFLDSGAFRVIDKRVALCN